MKRGSPSPPFGSFGTCPTPATPARCARALAASLREATSPRSHCSHCSQGEVVSVRTILLDGPPLPDLDLTAGSCDGGHLLASRSGVSILRVFVSMRKEAPDEA